MTLQGFSSRSKQGLYRSLQAFGQGTPPSRLLYGLTVGDDVVYVCDYLNHKILSYQLDGTKIDEWGTFGTTDGLIDRPSAVKWYNSEVYVFDATNRVQVFSESGTWDRTILTNVYTFDVYDGDIFSVSLATSAPSFYTPTFKKTDTDGVLISSFAFTDTFAMRINYEQGILNVLSYESGTPSLDLKFYILEDDGTISTEIVVDDEYPSNEEIQFGPIGIDDMHLYTKGPSFIYKHSRGGAYEDRESISSTTSALYDMDYYDSKLYFTKNFGDTTIAPKVRIHSASTLAFDTEWTAT